MFLIIARNQSDIEIIKERSGERFWQVGHNRPSKSSIDLPKGSLMNCKNVLFAMLLFATTSLSVGEPVKPANARSAYHADIVDGNEGSFYLDESQKYLTGSDQGDYPFVQSAARDLCAPELQAKWNRQGQVAMAPYVDLCYNLYSPIKWRTPEYESKWLWHNIYQSLLASDQYVWIYAAKIDFWTGAGAPPGLANPKNNMSCCVMTGSLLLSLGIAHSEPTFFFRPLVFARASIAIIFREAT